MLEVEEAKNQNYFSVKCESRKSRNPTDETAEYHRLSQLPAEPVHGQAKARGPVLRLPTSVRILCVGSTVVQFSFTNSPLLCSNRCFLGLKGNILLNYTQV